MTRIRGHNLVFYFTKGIPITIILGLIVIMVLTVACGSQSKENSLVIYAGRSESLVGPIIKQFGDATGIDVRVNYASTPQLAATLLEEGPNSPADIFFAQDPGGLGAVADMLTAIPRDSLDKVPAWARSPENTWVGISGRARVVVYNTSSLTEADLPDDIWNFIEPKWANRIGWAPFNTSFQTMVTGMRSSWGEDKARQWLEGIEANRPKIYPKNTPIVDAVARREIDVGFVNHYYLFRFLAEQGESFTARNYHPRSGGPGSLIMVAGVGILSSSTNKSNAENFIDFMLSPVAQQYFASQTFEYPLVSDVKVSQLLTPLDQINQPVISMKNLTDLKGTQDLLRTVGILP